ncbi:MAG: type II toxin-antitoxin system VapC family toxin [Candidatus Saccharimonadales bacterium]
MILIDSHIFVWALFEPERIGKQARAMLTEENDIQVSLASLWELALKHSKGRFAYPPDLLLKGVGELGATWLEITPRQITQSVTIPMVHLDPFDHMIAAQALCERVPLITYDSQMLDSAVPGLQLIDGRA